jgi:hypothetical protein
MFARRRTNVELKPISNEHQGACAARVLGETDRRSLCQECAAGRAIAVTRNPQPGLAAADRKYRNGLIENGAIRASESPRPG